MIHWSLILLSLLILDQIVEELACWYGAYDEITLENTVYKETNKTIHEFWSIPGETKTIYMKWFKDYYEKNPKEHSQASYEEFANSPDGQSLPGTWKGYGPGHGGANPPPWAIMKDAYGRPDFCFYEPEIGKCLNKIKRWGYNSYQAKCDTFNYSGCKGNANNFKTKKRCEEACKYPAQTNCQKKGEDKEYGG